MGSQNLNVAGPNRHGLHRAAAGGDATWRRETGEEEEDTVVS